MKIGDFGLAAKIEGKKKRTTNCGTPNYTAPEVSKENGYSFEVDVWSLGIVTYLLLYGHYPFDCDNKKSTTAKINSKTYLINPALS